MKFGLFAGVVSAAVIAGVAPASAAVVLSFGQGGSSPLTGLTVVEDFESGGASIISSTGTGFVIQSGSNSQGAAIPTSTFPGKKYLSVLGGGTATIGLGLNVNRFSFDWGSLDTYNTLTINYKIGNVLGSKVVIPGTTFVNTPANGNQTLPTTNGVFSVVATGGEIFQTIQVKSGSNSFELDNIATGAAVPEPATWAMMIIGFGAAGSMIRRRRAVALTA